MLNSVGFFFPRVDSYENIAIGSVTYLICPSSVFIADGDFYLHS
jgi:hypothetical protein